MSSIGGAAALESEGIPPVRPREEIELTAASFSDCKEAVKFDLNEDFDFATTRFCFGSGGKSSSPSISSVVIRGWSEAQSTDSGSDLGFSFLKFVIDFRLRKEPGVEGLPTDNTDWLSESRDGIESLEADLALR